MGGAGMLRLRQLSREGVEMDDIRIIGVVLGKRTAMGVQVVMVRRRRWRVALGQVVARILVVRLLMVVVEDGGSEKRRCP